MTSSPIAARTIASVLPTPAPHWVGDGFLVRPLFGAMAFTAIPSPFLMLDWAAPARFAPAAAPRGVGPHPHRGFETVTIVHDGEIEHRDSAGFHDRIGPGDVQWMTAGAGIVHEEMHGAAVTKTGGVVSMAQLWVNLPAAAKAVPPHYQSIGAATIPVVALDGGRLRVIAGRHVGDDGRETIGPATTHTPLTVWDVALEAGGRLDAAVPRDWTALVAVLDGVVDIAGRRIEAARVALTERDGDRLAITAVAGARLLVLAGAPIDEPIAAMGPFVMNTQAELVQAVADFRSGRMGVL